MELIEALFRGLRAVTLITGILVAIDAIGVMFKPVEHPPHKPKWNAAAWLLISLAAAFTTGYLTAGQIGLMTPEATSTERTVPLMLYIGLIGAFTVRAVIRAVKPWWTVLSVVCMSAAAVSMAVWDIGQ